MKMNIRSTGIVLLTASLTLVACSTNRQVSKQVNSDTDAITKAIDLPKVQRLNGIDVIDGAFIADAVIKSPHPLPASFKQKIGYITATPIPASEIISELSDRVGISIAYSAANKTINLSYTDGPLTGLLDQIALLTDTYWEFREGRINFDRFMTKSFVIEELPRDEEAQSTLHVTSGNGSSGGGGGGSGGGGGGGGGGGSTGGAQGSSGASQMGGGTISTSTHYTRNSWQDIRRSAEALIKNSSGASIDINPSIGVLTVTGTHSDVERVATWVADMNRYMGGQIEIDISVYNVDLQHEDNYGVNPIVNFNNKLKGAGYSVQSSSGNIPASVGADTASTVTTSILSNSRFVGSSAVLSALSTLGKVTNTYNKTEITKSGHAVVSNAGTNVGYLYSITSSQTANVGTSVSLVPGVVNTGFGTVLLPRIVNGNIELAVTLSSSQLDSISQAGSNGNYIQTPVTDSTTSQSDVVLHPGEALLLTSLTNTKAKSSHSGSGSAYVPMLGGGFDSFSEQSLMAVVVTAHILK